MRVPRILIACEESQAICTKFRAAGFEAFSCDIIPPSGGHPEWHICDDALHLIDNRCTEFTTMDGHIHSHIGWDLLIAHPPCTFLSNAGAARLFKKIDGKSFCEVSRLNLGFDAKDFFMAFYNANVKRIAV